MIFELNNLPYSFDFLEPHFDAKTMEIHHDKHHAAYIKNLNDALAGKAEYENWTLIDLCQKIETLSEDIKTKVRNNAGGHYNHSFFWPLLTNSSVLIHGNLETKITDTFGSIDAFKELFTKEALGRFGSGWVWLVKESQGNLKVMSTPNQDNPLMQGMQPVIGLDVWEHAYYLKYQNKRADFVAAFWNILNWQQAQMNFDELFTV